MIFKYKNWRVVEMQIPKTLDAFIKNIIPSGIRMFNISPISIGHPFIFSDHLIIFRVKDNRPQYFYTLTGFFRFHRTRNSSTRQFETKGELVCDHFKGFLFQIIEILNILVYNEWGN